MPLQFGVEEWNGKKLEGFRMREIRETGWVFIVERDGGMGAEEE